MATELQLSAGQCRSILRNEGVVKTPHGDFELIKDIEEDIVELSSNSYQREGTGVCLNKTTNKIYEFYYTESGRDPDDMSCYCSGYLTFVKDVK